MRTALPFDYFSDWLGLRYREAGISQDSATMCGYRRWHHSLHLRILTRAATMSFCDHCAGQRFDRAQVLRALRSARKDLRHRGRSSAAEAALTAAIEALRALEIPHLEEDEATHDDMVHW